MIRSMVSKSDLKFHSARGRLTDVSISEQAEFGVGKTEIGRLAASYLKRHKKSKL